MTKTKKKNIHKPLVVAGYSLFALLVVATLISTTIPFGLLLFNPRVLHINVAVTVISLTIGAILPVLIGYIIGGQSIKTKSKLSHHFTGVLFGLLAYWIMMAISLHMWLPSEVTEGSRNAGILLLNIIPSIGVAIAAAVISIAHVRSRHAKKDIIEYKPFSVLLVAAIIGLPLSSLVQNVIVHNFGIHSFVPIAMVAVLGLISYATLHKTKLSRYEKVNWSAVSLSVLFVAMFVMPQLVFALSNYVIPMSTMEQQALLSVISFFMAITTWFAYWLKQVRALL